MSHQFTFDELKADYQASLMREQVKPSWSGYFDRASDYIVRNRDKYEEIERRMGMPWQLIGALHWREAEGDFKGVLHNGERILGTGRKTRLEPKGRGPFKTWADAAIDALAIKGIKPGMDWTLERICYEAERFNGMGYREYHPNVKSPYLWSGTNLYTRGKYVSDGSFNGSVVDQQVGVLPLYQMTVDKTAPAEARSMSRKFDLLAKAKMGLKAAGGTIAGWFTLDTAGLLKEWAGVAEGILQPQTILLAILAGGAAWLIVTTLEKMMDEDAAAGAWEPSGASQGGQLTEATDVEPTT